MLKDSEPRSTYHLKVTLMETDPPIWRRPSVPGDMTLTGGPFDPDAFDLKAINAALKAWRRRSTTST